MVVVEVALPCDLKLSVVQDEAHLDRAGAARWHP